jgi:dTDP-glucose 4,6-dehydratase
VKFCILGGGGCFGINTAKYLLEQGHHVLSVGRFGEKPAPFSLELSHEHYRYVAFNINTERDMLLDELDVYRPHYLVNYAALAEVPLSFKYPDRYFETNLLAPIRLHMELAKRDYLNKWIQIGSSEIYGAIGETPAKEDNPPRCSTPYAVSKATFDMYLMTLSDFPWLIVRPSNAYCPGQLLHRVLPRAVLCGLTGEKMPLHGGGVVRKSYFHANDLAKAIELLAFRGITQNIYNVGPLQSVAIRDIVGLVAKHFGKSLEKFCDITPGRAVEDNHFWLDSSKIREIGWKDQISIEQGVIDMILWGRKYERQLCGMSPKYEMRA